MTPFEHIMHLRNGGRVTRWHAEPWDLDQKTDVAQHSFGVAVLMMELMEDHRNAASRYRLLRAAIFHDEAEQAVGDVPFFAKRFSKTLNDTLDTLEQGFKRFLSVNGEESLTREELEFFHLCDFLEHCFQSIEKYLSGNIRVFSVFKNLEDYANSSKITEYNSNPKASEIYEQIKQFWDAARNRQAGILHQVASIGVRQYYQAMDSSRIPKAAAGGDPPTD